MKFILIIKLVWDKSIILSEEDLIEKFKIVITLRKIFNNVLYDETEINFDKFYSIFKD